MSWISPLLQDPEVNVAVIHLVRDPRGILLSYWKAGWEQDPQKACDDLLDDLTNSQILRQQYPEKLVRSVN